MYATVRKYSDSGLADTLASRSVEVEDLIGTIPGFRGYFLVRTDDGGCATITIADDKSGTDESSRRAADWLQQNAADIKSSPPQISSGEVIFTIGALTRV